MEFVNDPRKAKIAFVLTLIFAIFFLLASTTLGYFYWQKVKAYKDLTAEKQKLEDQIKNSDQALAAKTASLQSQIDALAKDKTALEADKKNLEKQITDNNSKKASIASYLAVFTYLVDLIANHSGLDGWTDAEYQSGRALAVATGNNSFVADVDWAWNHKEVDQITRLVKVMRDIIAGINNGIK